MTVGIPLFDDRGELKYAVCFNTVSMEQINAVLAQIRASSEQNSAEVQALHTLVTQISDEIGNIFSTIRQVNETATTLQKISSSLI